MLFVTGSHQPARSTTLCSFVFVPNLTKRLEITLNFCAVVMHVSMLGLTLEDGARVLAELATEREAVVVGKEVARSEETIGWAFGRDEVMDVMAD